jgi:hypothetical protein
MTGTPFESGAVAVSVKGVSPLRDVDGCPLASLKISVILLVTVLALAWHFHHERDYLTSTWEKAK